MASLPAQCSAFARMRREVVFDEPKFLFRGPKSGGFSTPLLLSTEVVEDISCASTVLPLLSKLLALPRLMRSTGLAREQPTAHAIHARGSVGTRELLYDIAHDHLPRGIQI